MFNHQSSVLAGTSTTLTRFQPPLGGFDEGLRGLARRLLRSAVGISPADRQFLQDLARPESRYPMRTIRRINRIAACSVRAEDREGPAELIRADILAHTPMQACLASAFDRENEANDWADRAQWKLARMVTSATIEECQLALTQQLAMTREAIDIVTALRPVNRNADCEVDGPGRPRSQSAFTSGD